MLRQFGMDAKQIDLEKLKADFVKMQDEKTKLRGTYKSAEKEVKKINKKIEVISTYIQSNAKEANTKLLDNSLE